MLWFLKILRRFGRSERGVVSIEFAMALPILTAMLLSGLEVTRYVFLHQKLERVSTSISDLVAREAIITEAKVTDIFEITKHMMEPFDSSTGTQVIITSVNRSTAGEPLVSWQRSWGVGGNASQFGTEGGTATVPDTFVIRVGENIIATEVFHEFTPTFGQDVIGATSIKKLAIYRPRFGSLANLLD